MSCAEKSRTTLTLGIYPREPLNKKKANKGSSAPASFYYHKDIQYLLHEPLLVKFREHKTFAKKLARALGRGEWGLAKNLEDAKPIARLDHLVKERYVRAIEKLSQMTLITRYPTFTLALQDLQDPLNLVHLFSTLPTNPIPGKTLVPAEVISECGRLIAEWKVRYYALLRGATLTRSCGQLRRTRCAKSSLVSRECTTRSMPQDNQATLFRSDGSKATTSSNMSRTTWTSESSSLSSSSTGR